MPNPSALSPLEQQILAAKAKVRAEMPDVADVAIEPMGLMDRLMNAAREKVVGTGATTMAVTVPPSVFGSPSRVSLNMDALQGQSPAFIEDTIAHELTHARQGKREYDNKGFIDRVKQKIADLTQGSLPYGQQPDELEGFQAEGDRAVREGREPGITPNFSKPGYREKGDIVLRREKK